MAAPRADSISAPSGATARAGRIGDWVASWVAANPVGGSAWSGRWTASAVNMDAAAASGLYEFFPDEDGALSRAFEDEPNGQNFDWDQGFLYDPVTGLHTVGGGVGSSAAYGRAGELKTWYLRYDPRTNRWAKRNNPLGVGGSHHYAENAMDRVGRRFFRRFFMFDLDNWTAAPTVLPNPPGWGGGGSAQAKVFHEHLGRLYAISDDDRHWYWTPNTRVGYTSGTWSAQRSHGYDLGLHVTSAYHRGMKTAIFGGGNSPSTAFFKISEVGDVSRIDDPPSSILPISSAESVMIVDCGLPDAFVVLFDKSATTPAAQWRTIWLLKPNAASGAQWVQSTDSLPSYLQSWGGFRYHNAIGIPHLGLVMWITYYSSGVDTASDLKERRSSVYFYAPTGN